MTSRMFLSYSLPVMEFVLRVRHVLAKQPGIEPVAVALADADAIYLDKVTSAIAACDTFACFHDGQLGHIQQREVQFALDRRPAIRLIEVRLGGKPTTVVPGAAKPIDPMGATVQDRVVSCAKSLAGELWTGYDGVPSRYLFHYEKSIIASYSSPNGSTGLVEKVREGAPDAWPRAVRQAPLSDRGDPREVLGSARAEEASVGVSARPTAYPEPLTFAEAGPRRLRHFPRDGQRTLRVAILVSGGVAPGTNAVIAELIERHRQYLEDRQHCVVTGYSEGFKGLYEHQGGITLFDDVRNIHAVRLDERRQGGSVLPTARLGELLDPTESPRALKDVVDYLAPHTDILYVIGGDGSMRAAHAVAMIAREHKHRFSVVTVPKTTDNDILWVWQSFGFLSSVDRAVDFLIDLGTEVRSNPRLCVVQLFGSDSGFVVAHAALAAGGCTAVLIPELPFCTHELSRWVVEKLVERRDTGQSPWGLVLMAETAVPVDAGEFLQVPGGGVDLSAAESDAVRTFLERDRRVRGQTPDELRTAGRKIVSGMLQEAIRQRGHTDDYWRSFRVFGNEPRHLIRAIPPSTIDVVFGQRLAALAVDAAMAGYTDCMVSQWLTEYVVVPLELVVLGRKRLPRNGIFWRSVLSSTGQAPLLLCDTCLQNYESGPEVVEGT